ncbi:rifin [Plasmodium sp. gorilla clade G1]|nr:rifin [Plasmodium sp. gorilla clade G1]
MKLHYSKILLYSFSLIILVISSSNAYNKNKPNIITHTQTTTSRVLIECNIYMPNYDNEPDMNSVRENFQKQTEQRFHEYDKRMIKNRQKCKEKCDKEIQKIIVKDKIDKSLAEKVEKGCLKCGCGLGGVATSVGVLGTAVVSVLKKSAMDAAIGAAIAEGATAGEAAGHAAGAAKVVKFIESTFFIQQLGTQTVQSVFTAQNYTDVSKITLSVFTQYRGSCVLNVPIAGADKPFCTFMQESTFIEGPVSSDTLLPENFIRTSVQTMVSDAKRIAAGVTNTATEEAIATLIPKNIDAVNATYASCQTAIIASVVAILVIVLVMVIIYLILRYRRKKKMNKKVQYTKLLN